MAFCILYALRVQFHFPCFLVHALPTQPAATALTTQIRNHFLSATAAQTNKQLDMLRLLAFHLLRLKACHAVLVVCVFEQQWRRELRLRNTAYCLINVRASLHCRLCHACVCRCACSQRIVCLNFQFHEIFYLFAA